MIRRLLVASAAFVVAYVAVILGLAAARDAWARDSTPVILGLAAVWLAQAAYGLLRKPRPKAKPCQHIYGVRTVHHSYIRRHRAN